MSDFRIVYTNTEGGVSVVIPAWEVQVEEAAKAVPEGVPYEVVAPADIPADRTFRNGWKQAGRAIVHDLPRCKAIAHERRRLARAAEFAPLDIEATIPAKAQQAETKRQAIRDKYAVVQTLIDAAADVGQLKDILDSLP